MNTIGIIGGYGQGGIEATKILANLTDAPILIGGRDRQKADDAAAGLGPRARGAQVDIWEDRSLDRFCRGCRLVINCAGPSRRILDRVALAALAAGSHYMDMGGDDVLYNSLFPIDPGIREKGLSAITSTGMYPGLSGLFPAWAARHHFDRVDDLTLYFVNQGDVLTRTAAYDVVCSLTDDYAQGMVVYENGRVTRTGVSPVMADFPFFREKIMMYPSFTKELELLARDMNFSSARNYFAFDEQALSVIFSIHARKNRMTDKELEIAVTDLVEASRRDAEGKSPCTLIHLAMDGMLAGSPLNLSASLNYRGDGGRLMGMITGAVAVLLLSGHGIPGCHFMFDGIEGQVFMDLFSGLGLIPELKLKSTVLTETGTI